MYIIFSSIVILITIFFLLEVMKDFTPVKAVCVLDNQKIKGTIYLEELPNKKTKIYGTISGLKQGLHGFHIHEAGDLTDGCTSACAHYNPHGKNHGGPDDKDRHVGDLGNLDADKKGIAQFFIEDNLVKLRGKYSVIGRSLVIHEDPDDLGKGHHSDSLTTGHSGKRIACAVIGYAKNC